MTTISVLWHINSISVSCDFALVIISHPLTHHPGLPGWWLISLYGLQSSRQILIKNWRKYMVWRRGPCINISLTIEIIHRSLCDEEKDSSPETKFGQGEEAGMLVSGLAWLGPHKLWWTLLMTAFFALSLEGKQIGGPWGSLSSSSFGMQTHQGILLMTTCSIAPIHQPEILPQDRALILESWVLASLLSSVVNSSVRAGGSGGSSCYTKRAKSSLQCMRADAWFSLLFLGILGL
jgi:hypothetical protein